MKIIRTLITKGRLKSIGLGIIDSLPVISTIKANIESQEPKEGTVDIVRIITAGTSSIIILYAVYLFGKGEITLEQLQELIKTLL